MSAGNSVGTAATMRAAMSPQELLEFFGRQLADSGWKQSAATGPTVVRTWTQADSVGQAREVTLTVTPASNDTACHQVYMQVRTTRKP
jgi:hypothetical protein